MKKNRWIDKNDIFCLVLLTICFLAASTKITSYDFWWHVKTGELIYSTGHIPATDHFSFTSPGHPRIAHDWLSELIFYLLMQIGSFPAVVLLKGLTIAAAFFFIIRYLRKQETSFSWISLCVLLSMFGARFRFTERPELFSLFFTVLILFLLYDGRRTGDLWKFYCVVPAAALWVNLHGGGVLAPFYIIFFLIGELSDRAAPFLFRTTGREEGGKRISLSHLLLVLLLVLLVTLINPSGMELWKATSEANVMQSSGFAVNPEWSRPDAVDFPLFYLSLMLFLIVAAFSIKRLDFSQFFITLFLSFIACIYLRMIGFFFVALPFFLGTHATHMGITAKGKEFFRKVFESKFLPACSLVLIALSALFFIFYRGIQEFGFGVKPGRFPTEASDFLEKNYRGEFLYNDVRFGGYLIWRFYPERKVFVDGRNELYEALLARIAQGLNDYSEWHELLEDHKIDGALVSFWPELKGVIYGSAEEGQPSKKGYRAYSAFLFQKRDWALVYWDDLAMVFLKRNPRNALTIQKYEYRYLNPEDWEHILVLSREDRSLKENVLTEIVRRLNESPVSQKAALLYEKLKD